jgi:hypothetical protein
MFFAWAFTTVQAQQAQKINLSDTLTIETQAIKQGVTDRGGNEKEGWPAAFSVFSDLINNNNKGSLTLNSNLWTFYQLPKIVQHADTSVIDSTYRRLAPLRNLGLTCSITPDNKNHFTIDSGSVGIDYALLNNAITEADESDYQSVDSTINAIHAIDEYIAKYALNPSLPDADKKRIHTFLNQQAHQDTSLLTEDLRDSIRSIFHVSHSLSGTFSGYDSLAGRLARHMADKPLWTISLTDQMDSGRTPSYSLSSRFLLSKSVPLDVSASYSISADTSKKGGSLDQKVFDSNGGWNFQWQKWLECKVAAEYKHIFSGAEKNEDTDQYNFSVKTDLKVNQDVWLPVTIKYAAKTGSIWGFLSVQYSLF